jgi:translation initiation factor 1
VNAFSQPILAPTTLQAKRKKTSPTVLKKTSYSILVLKLILGDSLFFHCFDMWQGCMAGHTFQMAQKKKTYGDFSSLGGLVYSTDPDFKPANQKKSTGSITLPPNQQDLRIHLIRNKGNKVTTVIREFSGRNEDLEALGKLLKQACGTGGTVKDWEILIQGDKRKEVAARLEKEGYKYKLAGG